MKNLISARILSASLLIIALFISSTGFSQKKSVKSLPAGSIKPEYSYPADRNIKYMSTSKVVQDMDINGQSMLVNVSSYMECSVKSTGKQGENLNLEIKMDTLTQLIDSPNGPAGGTINEIRGKTFSVVISPSGKIVDLSEASKIAFEIPGSGPSDASETFLEFFPVLPSVPVKEGDTWTTHDTINTKSLTASRWMPVESNNKFEGIEKIDGIDCAKISATLTGSMKINTQTQGMSINTNGNYTGTKLFLFAIKEGYFIKETSSLRMAGTIDISDQNMSFPVVMDINSTNEAVK